MGNIGQVDSRPPARYRALVILSWSTELDQRLWAPQAEIRPGMLLPLDVRLVQEVKATRGELRQVCGE